jgi:hypothetical protein
MDHTTTVTTTTSLSISASGTYSPTGGASSANTQRTADGRVRFENDNYTITVGDNNEVLVKNKNTGEEYRIWGDPHVEVDGEHAFDFWGQTTFVLDDGTKVTIETTPWEGGDNGATVASEVTITDGKSDYTTVISGVDTNTKGDLSFREYEGDAAQMVELTERDGNTVYENENGKGFFAVDRNGNVRNVDQAFINGTDEVKNGGPTFMQQYAEMFQVFSGLMSIFFDGSFDSVDDGRPPTDVVHQSDEQTGTETETVSWAWSWSFSMTLTRVESI